MALGFRVKSGWAAACLVSGPASSPKVVDRRVVTLSDPEVPRSKQPYHSGTGFAETDAAKLARLVQSVEGYAEQSLAALFAQYRAEGRAPVRVGIVVGTDGDPERIANQHIQAHAREGRLFRRVIEDAARAHGLPFAILVEREAYRVAAGAASPSAPSSSPSATARSARPSASRSRSTRRSPSSSPRWARDSRRRAS